MASVTIDYQTVTATGRPLHTSSDPELARRWAKAHAHMYPGMVTNKVTTTVVVEKFYQPVAAKLPKRKAA